MVRPLRSSCSTAWRSSKSLQRQNPVSESRQRWKRVPCISDEGALSFLLGCVCHLRFCWLVRYLHCQLSCSSTTGRFSSELKVRHIASLNLFSWPEYLQGHWQQRSCNKFVSIYFSEGQCLKIRMSKICWAKTICWCKVNSASGPHLINAQSMNEKT